MEEDPIPIFDFSPLRQFLVDEGYIVEQAQGYRAITPEEITPEQIERGEIEFTDEGIYTNLEDGTRQQVFLYKRDYWLHLHGVRKENPRFHICKCDTIQQFINEGRFKEHYVKANSTPVPVIDLGMHRRLERINNLPLCQNCVSKIRSYRGITSDEFVELLRQARGENEEQEEQEVDIFGYTRDWDNISREYRESHNYTCEECGLRIDDLFDRQYIHVHHIDANKLNNRESNLKCLCLRCHSEVDEVHRQNLRTGANRIVWEAFNSAYPR